MRQYYAEVKGQKYLIFWAEKPIGAYKKISKQYGENNIIQFRPASVLDITHVKSLVKSGKGIIQDKKEVTSVKTKTGREIIGYGKSSKGRLIHAITGPTGKISMDDGAEIKTGTALCDKRTTGLEIDGKMTKDSVTCKTCLSYELLREETKDKKGKPQSKLKKTQTKKEEQKKKPKKKTMPKKQNHWKVVGTDKTTEKNILHVPTEQIMFEKIPTKVARRAVFEMNSTLDVEWKSKSDPIPDRFIEKIRESMAKAYKALGKDPDKALTGKGSDKGGKTPKGTKKALKGRKITRRKLSPKDKGQRPSEVDQRPSGRQITRRKKPSKARKITRRAKPGKGLLKGRREGSPAYTIGRAIMSKDGSSQSDIIRQLMSKHNLPEEKATSKIKGFVRKATRKQGYQIVIIQGKNPLDDHFIYGG